MDILNNEEDFKWHQKALDVAQKYNCAHYGDPEKYPCKVVSQFWDDPNGPYTYNHSFIYQQEVQCPHCGHTRLIWPNQAQ